MTGKEFLWQYIMIDRQIRSVKLQLDVGLVVQWSVAVGLGYIIGIPLEWGICGMWVAFLLDENIRGAIFVKRWYSMKWTTKGFVK